MGSYIYSNTICVLSVFQLSIYGRYFVNQYEAKIFAGVLGLVTGALYVADGLLVVRSIHSNL
jgi:hypothetical protein